MAPEPKASASTSTDDAKAASFAPAADVSYRCNRNRCRPTARSAEPAQTTIPVPRRRSAPVPASRCTADRSARRGRSAERIVAAQVMRSKRRCKGRNFCGRWSSTRRDGRSTAAKLRLFFPTESRALAEMLQARDPMERLRTVLNQVVGQPLRVCVKLDANGEAAGSGRNFGVARPVRRGSDR